MAGEKKAVAPKAEEKRAFPMLPINHWWGLRKKFKQSIPGVVTVSYLATVLGVQESSARANVLPFLKTLGIINDEGKTGERAKLWRDDAHYAGVCTAILSEVYPDELLHAVPNPSEERSKAESWFGHKTAAGAAAVKRMAALYEVIVEADASKQPEHERGEQRQKATKGRAAAKPKDATRDPAPAPAPPAVVPAPRGVPALHQTEGPSVYINMEVHISADATPDQIDKIFESMGKHIYKRG
jgi:hypothetical protein